MNDARILRLTPRPDVPGDHLSPTGRPSHQFGLRRQRLEIRLKHILYRSTLGKVAGLLGELAEGHGKPVEVGTEIGVRLRHHEMASIIGCRRASVSEALAELEYRGLIQAHRSRLVILKAEELEAIP